MSDQQDKNIEQVAQETAAGGDTASRDTASRGTASRDMPTGDTPTGDTPTGDTPAVEAATPPPAPDPAAVPPREAARPAGGGSSLVAWLALLLVLALAGGAFWWQQEQRRGEAAVLDRLQRLETLAGAKQANLEEFGDGLRSQFRAGLGKVQDRLEGVESATERLDSILASSTRSLEARLGDSIGALQEELAQQRAELTRYSANDRESWLLAEAEYLLRLANQRLIMAGDAKSAQALLASADSVLRELDDVALHEVRGAVTADLAAVRAMSSVDLEGIYLRLAALVEQADKLVIFELPEQESQSGQAPADGWQERLQQGYEEALAKLSNYVIIRRRDVPMEALIDPQWEGLVRQNLRMLLEQAQIALLSGNQSLYAESLQRAQHWVAQFFESDESAARAMAAEIAELEGLTIAVEIPDISRSLRSLDDAIEQRLKQGGAE